MRIKDKCEVCGEKNKNLLHRHHIIPQCDERCTNKDTNISILCANCHTKVHCGEIIIIGVYFTSSGKRTMWFKRGEVPPIEEEYWVVKDNPLVVRS